GTCPNLEESRRWKQKFELVTEVPPQVNVLDSSAVLNIANFLFIHFFSSSLNNVRKTLKFDDSLTRYDKLIKGLIVPLCWGIIDLRANNVAPCPNHPRAGEFFSNIEVQKLQQTQRRSILKKFSKEKRARGIKGVCSLLQIETDMVDIYDKDTQYIGECLDAFGGWVRSYGGTSNIERTIDMHLIGPFSKAPGIKFIYGESHSTADRDEKPFRSKCERTGKACDFLFWVRPMNKDHYKKSVTDFVSVIKVARAQHINFQTKCIEESGINPLPPEIENDLKLISIPFFQVIGMKI
ncbi:23139_t:CDS:2, partial [Gigaspora rosea]